MHSRDALSVGEMSRRTGLAVSALHFSERHGLIASSRTAGNQRRYPRHMLRRISLILVAKRRSGGAPSCNSRSRAPHPPSRGRGCAAVAGAGRS
jgi:hypothetical protein